MKKLGIIGGSGLDDPQFMKSARDVQVDTPYGSPSSPFLCGELEGREVAMLARHGRQHTIPPTQINSRANLWAFQELGCERVVATAACGSLRENLSPGDMVVPDQFIDFTRHRPITFHEKFSPGIENARHTAMAEPFDETMRRHLIASGRELLLPLSESGVILTIEGPRFSTRAESRMFRNWGADLINMTVAPEAILANELELPYSVVAVVTDYDSWKDDSPPLRIEDLMRVFGENVDKLTRLLLKTIPKLDVS